MNDFIDPQAQKRFQQAGLLDFDTLWNLPSDWFEPPNQRRGGWSGVSFITVQGQGVFLKRQYNHKRRTWLAPWGAPSFRFEARNLRRLQSKGIAAPYLLYYAERGPRAILATAQLQDCLPLDALIDQWQRTNWAQHKAKRQRLIHQLAKLIARLHQHHLAHHALHAKHVFVHLESMQPYLIDLEKMRWRLNRKRLALRDLDALNRHTPGFSRTDRLRFLLAYLQKTRLDEPSKHMIHKLWARQQRKRHQHA